MEQIPFPYLIETARGIYISKLTEVGSWPRCKDIPHLFPSSIAGMPVIVGAQIWCWPRTASNDLLLNVEHMPFAHVCAPSMHCSDVRHVGFCSKYFRDAVVVGVAVNRLAKVFAEHCAISMLCRIFLGRKYPVPMYAARLIQRQLFHWLDYSCFFVHHRCVAQRPSASYPFAPCMLIGRSQRGSKNKVVYLAFHDQVRPDLEICWYQEEWGKPILHACHATPCSLHMS